MSFFFIKSGCFLPFLALFNLIFGWLVFPPLIWLSLEGILILLFIINSCILVRRLSAMASNTDLSKRSGAIDVEGKAVDAGE